MIIFRYFAREVLNTLMLIIILLLLVFITNFFTSYMDLLADGNITLLSLLKIISMQVPLLLGYLLPLALFLSILIVYARLYLQNEMVVLHSCGFGRAKLYLYTLGYSSIVILIIVLLMLYVEPIMQKYRLQLKAEAFAQATISKVTPNRFIPLGHLNGYFYANDVEGFHQRLNQVWWGRPLSSKQGKARAWDVVSAQWADEEAMPGIIDHFLVFHQGSEYVGTPGQRDFKISHFKRYGVRLVSKVGALNNPIKFATTATLFAQKDHNKTAYAELQWRLAMPISAIILIFIAVYFSQMNARRGSKFLHFFVATLLYVLYADLMFVGRDKIDAGSLFSLRWGMWWVHGLFLLLAAGLMTHDFKLFKRCRSIKKSDS